ncbi:glutathionyl-hydroquinone reductase YqjG [Kiloniella litopenaei]|uniref:Glutathionyl-hydroquinone reductase YqjG n=1 Tax=Kiloniella litopenaei TaxID=1549748 RepID=A0A0M2RFG5_9PROT|nr:glutathione S-transferase family protein [Kiloniella litopenaei]KKJ78760.1 glutathionyl-hydroquinone reductase YqjG [Kiloniella litopenaei]
MPGKLINGIWTREEDIKASEDGQYRREETSFRHWILPKGNGGERGTDEANTKFIPEAGRYHLYVSDACPWAHRTLVMRSLKGLEDAISVSTVSPILKDDGWEFTDNTPDNTPVNAPDFGGEYPDHLFGKSFLREIYTAADPTYTGRVSVPVLWDKKLKTIVSNESAEIMRMLNSAFVGVAGNDTNFVPDDLRDEIDAVNDLVYQKINNGVYRCGFAGSQAAYEDAVGGLFDTLDVLETRLDGVEYLVGNQLTEADLRLFTTLIRFDAVYYSLFKCNLRRIADYPNLSALVRRIYGHGSVAQTVKLDQIKIHYWVSLRQLNPTGIVPVGPEAVL